MMPNEEPNLLAPEQFTAYQGAWVSLVQSASSEQLRELFVGPEGQPLAFASLGAQPLVWLLSAPNVRQVKTRFVLLPSAGAGQSRFAIALYSADKEGRRLSAYYLADSPWPPADPAQTEPLPQTLADTWVANWVASEATPAQFTTPDGPLEGYTFKVADFIDPLFGTESLQDVALRLNFGLHCYYAPTEQPERAQLFGLVLRLNAPGSASARTAPFYDLGDSNPPF